MKKLLVIIAFAAVAAGGVRAYGQDAKPAPAVTADTPPPSTGAAQPAAEPELPAPMLPIEGDRTKKCPKREENPALPAWIRELNESCWTTAGNFWFPVAAADAAEASDFMFYVVLALSIFFFVAITACIVYFVIRYRYRPGHKAEPSSSHNDVLEITWTVIPTIICVFLFVGGWNGYIAMFTRPPEAIQIKVTAQKWNWDFEYPNGLHLPYLVVPKDRPVELQMTSTDVLHAFFVPAFRTKQDIVPRRYTYVFFTATRLGVYRLYCAEYCGRDHSQMKEKAFVLDYSVWLRYLNESNAVFNNLSGPDLGKQVYETKGCKGCHSIDGSRVVGPSWKGSWGTDIPLEGGGNAKMDADFVKTAVTEPAKQIHASYPNSMPSYAGQLKEAEIAGVAAYIESLK
jgi:cytochrome c oxidase subunit 2